MKHQVKLNLLETSVKYYEKLLLITNLFIRKTSVLLREVEPLSLNEYFLVKNFVTSLVSNGISTMGSLNVKIQVVRENVRNMDYVSQGFCYYTLNDDFFIIG